MTARWVVDEVRPNRDIEVTWQPISLFRKNEADPETERGARYWRTHRLLRVMESVRETDGEAAVEAFYWELGRRIHHDRTLEFDVDVHKQDGMRVQTGCWTYELYAAREAAR